MTNQNQNQNQSQGGAKRYDPNNVSVGGRLSKDPELRYTPNNKAVTNVTLANNAGEQTYWIDVVIWGAQAESLCNHLKKGSYIVVEGPLTTRSYENTDGKKIKTTEVLARSVIWMDNVGRNNSNNAQSGSNDYGQNQQYGQGQQYGQNQQPQYQQNQQPQYDQNQQYGQQPAYQQNQQPAYQQGQPAYGNGQQTYGNAAQNNVPDVPNGNGINIQVSEDDLPF